VKESFQFVELILRRSGHLPATPFVFPNVTNVGALMQCVKALVYCYEKNLHYVPTKVCCWHDFRTFYTFYVTVVTPPTSLPPEDKSTNALVGVGRVQQIMKRMKIFSY
jgi:hypothetical protein